jgi:hypothetical protein
VAARKVLRATAIRVAQAIPRHLARSFAQSAAQAAVPEQQVRRQPAVLAQPLAGLSVVLAAVQVWVALAAQGRACCLASAQVVVQVVAEPAEQAASTAARALKVRTPQTMLVELRVRK